MKNPMLSQLSQTQNPMFGNLKAIKQMMSTIKSAQNPQQMLNNMMMQNPQYKQVMDYINQNGGDAKTAFYKMAQEKGVNPNDIINALK